MTLAKKVLDLAIQIQQISAPTFAEGQRGEFIRDLFAQEKLDDVSMDSLGNVYARLPGKQKKARALIVSAHLDTVFPAGTKLQITERNEHRTQMRSAKSYDDCVALRDKHREQMLARAKERGITMPAQPRRDACQGLKR